MDETAAEQELANDPYAAGVPDGLVPTADAPAVGDEEAYVGAPLAVNDAVDLYGNYCEEENATEAFQSKVDTYAAQMELAPMFSLVAEDASGPQPPNAVTYEEYQAIAKLYSDIRRGSAGIQIDTSELSDADAQAYRAGLMKDVALMLQTRSGRAALTRLAYLRPDGEDACGNNEYVTTTISAYHQDANGNDDHSDDPTAPLDTTNAEADPDDHADAVDGDGSDVSIRYNPGVNIGANSRRAWLRTMRGDVTLMHESVHAMNQTAGTLPDASQRVTPYDSAMREAAQGDVAGMVNEYNNPDVAMQNDAYGYYDGGKWVKPLRRSEHQAAGLGLYADDDVTENAYRRERAELAAMGAVGTLPDDANMPQRDSYR